MHEFSLIANLIKKIRSLAGEHPGRKIVAVNVTLGALSHISASHFREHFAQASRGTAAEGARLNVESKSDIADPHAQEIILESVELEE